MSRNDQRFTTEMLPEGSADYVKGYQDGYSKTRRQQRVKYATIGAAGSGVLVGTAVVAFYAIIIAGSAF